MFRSIRWKFIIIYFMLVFIAMIISGVFVIKFFEKYHLDIISERLTDLSKEYIPQLEVLDFSQEDQDKMQQILFQHKAVGFREEIYVINAKNNIILASSTEKQGLSAIEVISSSYSLIAESLNGKKVERDIQAVKHLAVPIMKNNQVEGILYLRYDLTETYETLDSSKQIIIEATGLALVITVLLSYVIAKSVTEPINAVTEKASKMAGGDFNQYVDVRSDDEIGKLAEMFNHLTRKLKNTLGEMSREKSKLEAILNYMADGLVAVDEEGKILHMNPKAKEIFKMGKEETDGRIYDELVEPYNSELAVSKVIESVGDWIGTGRLEKDNSVYTVNYAPFRNEQGEKKGLVFVFQDITEQSRLDQMRREFVANVSHELKTPLTSIKSYTETLLDGLLEDTDTAEHFLKVIDHESDRMARLVRDLLQLSNFDANMVRFEMEYHDYVDLVNKTAAKLDVTAKNRQQEIRLNLQCEELVGYFDYDRLEQVLQNILTNAIKYTPEGGTIDVYLWEQDQRAVLKVMDTGIGIPAVDLERIFERFYRVDKARARNLGGTGLGLSIAKEIVQAHEGTIAIDSVVEQGTVVEIHIPLKIS